MTHAKVGIVDTRPGWRLTATVLLPFAAGYYLSYVFRTINALIADALQADAGLGPGDLGLLTSTYFLAMAVVQLPVGILLDRHGPRRVQSGCLLIAAAGAVVFGLSHSLLGLLAGRTLIGIGLGAALMAGLKVIVLWVPPARVASANGWLITLGALGAVTATVPAQGLIAAIGWRGLFLLLAAATVLCAVVVFLVVPDPERPTNADDRHQPMSLRLIYGDKRFWKLAPMSAVTIGSAWAIQGLWAAPWLASVEGFDRPTVVRHLLVMAIALCISGLAFGRLAGAARHRGIPAEWLLAGIAIIGIVAQLAVILRWPLPSYLLWALMACGGAATVLSYAILPGYFPKAASGRANAALNLLHLTVAFLVQWMSGVIIDLWPSADGRHPVEAYQAAFAMIAALQGAAVVWFAFPVVVPVRRSRPLPSRPELLSAVWVVPSDRRYQDARHVWQTRSNEAEAQKVLWRRTALCSAIMCGLMIGSVVEAIIGSPLSVHAIAWEEPVR